MPTSPLHWVTRPADMYVHEARGQPPTHGASALDPPPGSNYSASVHGHLLLGQTGNASHDWDSGAAGCGGSGGYGGQALLATQWGLTGESGDKLV